MSSNAPEVGSHRLYQGRPQGLFARDVYAAASEIDRVEDDPVKGDKVILNVPEDMLLQEASDGRGVAARLQADDETSGAVGG